MSRGHLATYLSPFILCRFLCGEPPGVLSRCCRAISLTRAWFTASASRSPVLVIPLDRLLCSVFLKLGPSASCLTSSRPRSC